MSSIFDYFDAIYCINLSRRSDRWQEVQKEFDKVGIKNKVIRFCAVETPNNWHIGCMLSHRGILKEAKKNWYKNILVFEDDVKFYWQNEQSLQLIMPFLKEEKWDLLYLGWYICFWACPAMINKWNFYQCTWILGTFAIWYSNRIFEKLLEQIPNSYKESEKFIKKHTAFDLFLWRYIQNQWRAFFLKKVFCGHMPGISDILKKEYNSDRRTYNMFNKIQRIPNFIHRILFLINKIIAYAKK